MPGIAIIVICFELIFYKYYNFIATVKLISLKTNLESL